jgi:hypothetical protein
MSSLEHDPRTKQQIKDALYAFIYDPVEKQFKSRLDTLIIRNTIMGGHSHRHFTYKGELYCCDSTPMPFRKNRLQALLRPEMDSYLLERHQLNTEELPYVLGFINQVLNSSCDLTDYLRVFPEAIHYPLTQLISTCPCRKTSLGEGRVETLKAKNEEPISLMKQRLVMNLLI